MVKTGHVSHDGFLVRARRVHDVCKEPNWLNWEQTGNRLGTAPGIPNPGEIPPLGWGKKIGAKREKKSGLGRVRAPPPGIEGLKSCGVLELINCGMLGLINCGVLKSAVSSGSWCLLPVRESPSKIPGKIPEFQAYPRRRASWECPGISRPPRRRC